MNHIKNKPNLLFLIAIRSQSLYKRLVIVLQKLQQPIYRKKLIRLLTVHLVIANEYEKWTINNMLHREDGPAYITFKYYTSEKSNLPHKYEWYYCDKLHNIDADKPSIILFNGRMEWFSHGMRHRKNGPAILSPRKHESWWQNDMPHREDGPAVIWENGGTEIWLEGNMFRSTDCYAYRQHIEQMLAKRAWLEKK
jgi:hypothetical protein